MPSTAYKDILTQFDALDSEERIRLVDELASLLVPKNLKRGELIIAMIEGFPRWCVCLGGGSHLRVWPYGVPANHYFFIEWRNIIRHTSEVFELAGKGKSKTISRTEIDNVQKRIVDNRATLKRNVRVMVRQRKSGETHAFGYVNNIEGDEVEIAFDGGSVKLFNKRYVIPLRKG